MHHFPYSGAEFQGNLVVWVEEPFILGLVFQFSVSSKEDYIENMADSSRTEPAMHELFLTTSIRGEDCSHVTRILQGYCAMKPSPLLRRRLIWGGPTNRNSYKGFAAEFIVSQGSKSAMWRTLSEQIIRQSYFITLLYDIKRDQFPRGSDDDSEEKS